MNDTDKNLNEEVGKDVGTIFDGPRELYGQGDGLEKESGLGLKECVGFKIWM